MITANLRRPNPAKMDPSRTSGLRRQWIADLRRRFARVKARLLELVRDEDAFGLEVRRSAVVGNQRFAFVSDPAKLRAFRDWLGRLLARELVGRTEDELWRRYVEEGFRKGQGRVWDDFKRRSDPEYVGRPEGFFEGTREEFLRSSFANPVAVEKVKLLAARTFEDVKTVAEEMRTRLGRVLVDGLVQGMHPREVARGMAEQLDISYSKAERIARTETIRAHAEGQLTALEDLGVTEVGVMVEWTVTNDSVLCPRCAEMEGVVLAVEDARGLLPLHPN